MSPETRCEVCTYGDCFVRATWIDAGPHGMNEARFRSRIRNSDLCTCGRQTVSVQFADGYKGDDKCLE